MFASTLELSRLFVATIFDLFDTTWIRRLPQALPHNSDQRAEISGNIVGSGTLVLRPEELLSRFVVWARTEFLTTSGGK